MPMAGTPMLPTSLTSSPKAFKIWAINEQTVPLPLVAVTPMIVQGQWSKKYLVMLEPFGKWSGGTDGLLKTRS